MIKFKKFINAIQQAILGANEELMDKNLSLLDKFFFEVPSTAQGSPPSASTALHPKNVVLQYPRQTPNGIEMTDVHVPLITLVPLSLTQVESVRLRADLEFALVDDEIEISFSSGGDNQRGCGIFDRGRRGRGSGRLDITLGPCVGSEGLRHLVEGYEKLFRAQLPH